MSSHRRFSIKKVFLKFSKFHRKTPVIAIQSKQMYNKLLLSIILTPQSAFISSKLIIETLEQGVKYVKSLQ